MTRSALLAAAIFGTSLVGCVDTNTGAAGSADPTPSATPSPSATPTPIPSPSPTPTPSGAVHLVAVTFNTGTSESMGHDNPPDDGYSGADATTSDQWYGDGLSWLPAVAAARDWLAAVSPDVISFQEIFWAGDCVNIPASAYPEFFCETWLPGDPTVAQEVLGPDYQIACNLGKTDKCAAVKRSFGTFQGCTEDICLDGLAGARVDGCGSGSRVGRSVIELATGGTLTLVNVHGSSGMAADDQDCRKKQFDQIFSDLGLGDGTPAANGGMNLVLGDFNTDPVRLTFLDESAQHLADIVLDGNSPLSFVSSVGWDAPPSYADLFNIDHVLSDRLSGSCWTAGVTEGHDKVTEAVYFDHKPTVCTLDGTLP